MILNYLLIVGLFDWFTKYVSMRKIFSSLIQNKATEGHTKETTTVWSLLPEDCVSDILSLTSPRDTCSLAAASSICRSVADSDAVWGRFLPPDYENVLSRAFFPVEFSSKKELFFRLCHIPVIIDGGRKSLMLEKSTGKKCCMLSARELSIKYGDHSRCWAWRRHPYSRFEDVVFLLSSVAWLEITGRLKTAELSPNTTYVAYLIYELPAENVYGLYHPNQKTSVFVGDQHSTGTVCLLQKMRMNQQRIANHSAYVREDGWLEVVMGEFFNEAGNEDEVVMNLLEIEGGQYWMTGLVVEGIELRPKKYS